MLCENHKKYIWCIVVYWNKVHQSKVTFYYIHNWILFHQNLIPHQYNFYRLDKSKVDKMNKLSYTLNVCDRNIAFQFSKG
jgi:hypothetical protein